jgi:hypothetical protein
MKKTLPLLFICCLIAAACHKNNSTKIDGLYGQWRWVRTDYTFLQTSGTAYPPALSNTVLQLNDNFTFSITQDGKQLADSTYGLNVTCPNGQCDTIATFQNAYSENAAQGYYWLLGNYQVSLRNDSLVLTFAGPWNPGGGGSTQWFVPE